MLFLSYILQLPLSLVLCLLVCKSLYKYSQIFEPPASQIKTFNRTHRADNVNCEIIAIESELICGQDAMKLLQMMRCIRSRKLKMVC